MPFQAPAVLVLAALASTSVCPDDGDMTFFQGSKGFTGVGFFGDESFESYFVGPSFRKASSDEPMPPGRAMFWLGPILAQWQLVRSSAFQAPRGGSPKEVLDAHFAFEFGYLQELARQGKAHFAEAEQYEVIAKQGRDLRLRHFKIWQARVGSSLDGMQFWVTAAHPRGVVLLALILGDKADEPSARKVIDSYIASFNGVDRQECQRLRQQVERDLPKAR